MIQFLLIPLMFLASAHEELKSLECKQADQVLSVSKKGASYTAQITTTKGPQSFTIPSFEVRDYFDKKTRQVFDVFTDKSSAYQLQVKKPETKGPVTTVTAKVSGAFQPPLTFSNCKLNEL